MELEDLAIEMLAHGLSVRRQRCIQGRERSTALIEGGRVADWGAAVGGLSSVRPAPIYSILAVLIDGDGRPVCSEMWPGNTADATTLIPVIDRLRRRFDIARVYVVADRCMISAETLGRAGGAAALVYPGRARAVGQAGTRAGAPTIWRRSCRW